jgi:hypothetical protein
MNATAANLSERVLPPQSGLRQWVLTFPFSWRRRLAQDGGLLGRLTRIAVETVLAFYAGRAGEERGPRAKSGAVTAVQRTSSDLRLNPHLHMIALDGGWREKDGELAWEGLGHLRTSEVGEVLERLVRRMEKYLRRNGQLRTLERQGVEASAVLRRAHGPANHFDALRGIGFASQVPDECGVVQGSLRSGCLLQQRPSARNSLVGGGENVLTLRPTSARHRRRVPAPACF